MTVAHRCSATTKKAGRRCTRAAMGNGLCTVHGGRDDRFAPKLARPCRCIGGPMILDVDDDGARRCRSCGRGVQVNGSGNGRSPESASKAPDTGAEGDRSRRSVPVGGGR